MLTRQRCCCDCAVTITVLGCNDMPLQAATVNIWTDDTKTTLVATGETDSAGQVTLDIGSAGTYYREVDAERFDLFGEDHAYICDAVDDIVDTLVVDDASYACHPACAYPVAKTLYFTDTLYGSGTATWTDAGLGGPRWEGTGDSAYSYPGCYGCAADSLTLTFTLDSAIVWNADLNSTNCPDESETDICSTGGPDSYATTCYVPGVSDFERQMIYDAEPFGSPIEACLCKFVCGGDFDGIDCSEPGHTITWTE